MRNLTYFFTCCFNDGSTIQQTPEDTSKIDSTRSAFYDVLQCIDEVETFTLTKQDGRRHTYMVDLRDGHFEIDGVPFFTSAEELPKAKFRLIYFHRHQHRVVQGQISTGDEALIQYFIGWQTLIDGKNFQSMISVR